MRNWPLPVLICGSILLAGSAQTPGQAKKLLLKDSDTPGPLWTSRDPSYAAIDKHAVDAPRSAEGSVPALAVYLVQPAKNDAHKARAIFRWMTDRIAYDADAFLARRFSDSSPTKVLKDRVTMCEGYSRLFKALGDKAGLETALIPGHIRYANSRASDALTTNHGWNAVKLDGRWYLLDVTWGAGEMNPLTRKWDKRFREYYFLTPPERLVFSHFPEAPAHQLLKPPIPAGTFRQRLVVPFELVVFGAPVRDIQSALDAKDFRGIVKINWDPNEPLRIVEAPLTRKLKKGEKYSFRLEASECSAMMLVNNGKSQMLPSKEAVFAGSVTPAAGQLQLGAQFVSKGKGYWTFLEYEVE